MIKRITIAFICFILPSFILRVLLPLFGYKIGKKFKLGFTILIVNKLEIGDSVTISHFNFIKVDSLEMKDRAYVGVLNFIRGPIKIVLNKRAAIGKNNVIRRSPLGISQGEAHVYLGELTKITAFHFLDVTKSIKFGDFSVLAGIRSQLWTHGYVHAPEGPDRFRVDGEIIIGNNVYLGSGVMINPGVEIADTINVGGNSTISRSLTEPGMYVSQPLRHLPKDYESIKKSLTEVTENGLIEKIFEKKRYQ